MTIEQIRAVVKKQLTQQEFYLLILNQSMQQSEIADRLGLTRQRVSVIIKNAEEKIKPLLVSEPKAKTPPVVLDKEELW